MAIEMRRLAVNAGSVVSNNLGGFVYSIKDSNGNSVLDTGFNSLIAPLNLGGAGKYLKTLVYDVVALGALEFTEGKSPETQIAGGYLAQFASGLGTATMAADPAPAATNVTVESPTGAGVVQTSAQGVKVIY